MWTSATRISVDISKISRFLWPEIPKITFQVRITTFDPTAPRGQRPISAWLSAQLVLATDANACHFTNSTITRPALSYYPLRDPTRTAIPQNMHLFQYSMYNLATYASTEHRHPGTNFLHLANGRYQTGLQAVAAGDGTLVGYYDPSANPTTADDQPPWVINASPTDMNIRAFIVIRTWINVNLNNSTTAGLPVERGWNNLPDAGTQRVQCFTTSGTVLRVWGYNNTGGQVTWTEDNTLPSGPTVIVAPIPISSWRTFCAP